MTRDEDKQDLCDVVTGVSRATRDDPGGDVDVCHRPRPCSVHPPELFLTLTNRIEAAEERIADLERELHEQERYASAVGDELTLCRECENEAAEVFERIRLELEAEVKP